MKQPPRKPNRAGKVAANRLPAPSVAKEESKRIKAILGTLGRTYPAADCALDRRNVFELLCATILSAQCTDERVNTVTPTLFARFPSPARMATASQDEMEGIIRSTGFFRNKAKNLIGSARMLQERWNGAVPRTMDELLALPGVARKTANVVLGTGYGIASGIVVDTHVTRLAQRLGLSQSTTAEQIERDLQQVVPRERWILFSHQLIAHGRRICQARKPSCDVCPLAPQCPSAFNVG